MVAAWLVQLTPTELTHTCSRASCCVVRDLCLDVPVQETRKNDSDDQALLDFARGISGGGPVVRSSYLFDAVNLPQVRRDSSQFICVQMS